MFFLSINSQFKAPSIDISSVNSGQLSAAKWDSMYKISFFYLQFLNLNISVSIKPNNLKFSERIPNSFMQGRMSKNTNLGPSYHFMK